MARPFLALLLILVAPPEPAPWHERETVDGFQVQDREVPGIAYKELRISTVSHQELASLCDAVLAEGNDGSEGRFKKREVLRETTNERWVYEQVSVPILRDRDYVTHLRLEQPRSPDHCEISFRVENDSERPPVPGIVRVPYSQGRWTLFQAGGAVNLSYEVVSDPGEHLAPALVRGGQQDAAVQAVKAVLARAALR